MKGRHGPHGPHGPNFITRTLPNGLKEWAGAYPPTEEQKAKLERINKEILAKQEEDKKKAEAPKIPDIAFSLPTNDPEFVGRMYDAPKKEDLKEDVKEDVKALPAFPTVDFITQSKKVGPLMSVYVSLGSYLKEALRKKNEEFVPKYYVEPVIKHFNKNVEHWNAKEYSKIKPLPESAYFMPKPYSTDRNGNVVMGLPFDYRIGQYTNLIPVDVETGNLLPALDDAYNKLLEPYLKDYRYQPDEQGKQNELKLVEEMKKVGKFKFAPPLGKSIETKNRGPNDGGFSDNLASQWNNRVITYNSKDGIFGEYRKDKYSMFAQRQIKNAPAEGKVITGKEPDLDAIPITYEEFSKENEIRPLLADAWWVTRQIDQQVEIAKPFAEAEAKEKEARKILSAKKAVKAKSEPKEELIDTMVHRSSSHKSSIDKSDILAPIMPVKVEPPEPPRSKIVPMLSRPTLNYGIAGDDTYSSFNSLLFEGLSKKAIEIKKPSLLGSKVSKEESLAPRKSGEDLDLASAALDIINKPRPSTVQSFNSLSWLKSKYSSVPETQKDTSFGNVLGIVLNPAKKTNAEMVGALNTLKSEWRSNQVDSSLSDNSVLQKAVFSATNPKKRTKFLAFLD